MHMTIGTQFLLEHLELNHDLAKDMTDKETGKQLSYIQARDNLRLMIALGIKNIKLG